MIDLLFRYPFPGGDGYDWIANGLALAGEETRCSGRPPLLPALIALLYRLGALGWLPFVLVGLLLLLAAACARIAVPAGERLASRRLRAGTLFFASAVYLRQGLEVMADVGAAALGAVGLAVALSALRTASERRWLAAGALVGVGSLAQPAALYAIAGIGAVLLVERRPLLRTRAPWLALALALAPTPLALLLRHVTTGSFENVAFLQRTLVGWHPEQLAYYAPVLPGALGAAAFLLVVAGALTALRSRRGPGDPAALAALASGAAVALFFGALYGYPAQRFTLYLAPLLAVGFDRGLEGLRGRLGAGLASAAALVALVTAAVPSGAEGSVVLWPAPLVRWDSTHGGLRLGGLEPALARHPLPALVGYLAAPKAELDLSSARPDDFEAVIYLYDERVGGENFFAEALRLGNAFGRRGRPLPVGLLPDRFFPRGSLEPLGTSLGYRFDRFRPFRVGPEAGRVWLLASSVGGGIDPRRWLDRRPSDAARDGLARALDEVRCAEALLPARDAPLVLLGDEMETSVAATALGTRTGTLLVVPARDVDRWRRRGRELPREAEERCGALHARRVRWEGFSYTVVTSLDSGP